MSVCNPGVEPDHATEGEGDNEGNHYPVAGHVPDDDANEAEH